MKVSESEKRKVMRLVAPGTTVKISGGHHPSETWSASEVYLNNGGLSVSCSFHSDWGRKFTHTRRNDNLIPCRSITHDPR